MDRSEKTHATNRLDEDVACFASCEFGDEFLGTRELDIQFQTLFDNLDVSKDLLAITVQVGVDGRVTPTCENRGAAADNEDPARL